MKNKTTILKKVQHIFLFPVVFVYFEILLRLFNGTGVFTHLIYPVLFGIAGGFLFAVITSLFSTKVNRLLSITLLFLTGLLFITECIIKDSFQVYMPLKAVLTGADGVIGGFTSDLFRAIFHGIPVILLFFLPCILYMRYGHEKLPARQQDIRFVLFLLVCALIFTGIGSFNVSIGKARDKYKKQFEFDTATQYFGLLTSLRLNIHYGLFGNDSASEFEIDTPNKNTDDKETSFEKISSETDDSEKKEPDYGVNAVELNLEERIASAPNETIANLHTYVNSLTPSKKNAYTGLFKGKNLILICAEALSDVVINEQLTPTLYRMTHNGFYFSDYYQPTWGGSTSSGEYSFLTGLAPLDGVNTMLETQNKNEYYTMGNQLKRLGYFSRSYHSGEYDYYSRHLTHENLGYEQFLGLGNGLEDITNWWPRDRVLFDKTMDTYIDKQPFSIYYMTLSGHCTYKAEDYRAKENIDAVRNAYGDRYKDTTNYYLAYQMELEYALRTMIEKLEAAGIADDTVICLTSDHYPYGLEDSATFGNTENYVNDLYGYEYTNAWEKDHNSLIIWSGCLENEKKDMVREISTPTYSLDILPTLSNLFGVEYDSRLLVGRDVFSDAEPLVLWNNHSWITTEGKYNARNNTFTPNEGSNADEAYVERIKSIVNNKLNFSGQVLENDYYNVLFGEKSPEN